MHAQIIESALLSQQSILYFSIQKYNIHYLLIIVNRLFPIVYNFFLMYNLKVLKKGLVK